MPWTQRGKTLNPAKLGPQTKVVQSKGEFSAKVGI